MTSRDLYAAIDRLYDSFPFGEVRAPLEALAFRLFSEMGEEDPLRICLYNELGGYYRNAGFFGPAEENLLAAVRLAERVLAEDDPNYATSLNNLAGLYRMMGRFEKAEALLERTCEIYRRKPGERSVLYCSALNNRALTALERRDYAGAEALSRRCIAILEGMELGEEEYTLGISCENLAAACSALGKHEEAGRYYRKAYRILAGTQEPGAAQIPLLSGMAADLAAQGCFMAAMPYAEEALALARRFSGTDQAMTADCLYNLAALYQKTGRNAEAAEKAGRALAIREKIFGTEHVLTKDCRALMELAAER